MRGREGRYCEIGQEWEVAEDDRDQTPSFKKASLGTLYSRLLTHDS
jgi:hypothetical protein